MALLSDHDESRLLEPLTEHRPTWYRVVRWWLRVLWWIIVVVFLLGVFYGMRSYFS